MLPEILCIVKQQNQAQYDFVKLEINSVLSYSLLVRDGSFCLSFVASLKQRSWTSKVYCMSSKLSRSRLMSSNNKITILLQAKHVLVIRAIAWMYLTSLIRNECWQNSWWEDNTLQWLFKRFVCSSTISLDLLYVLFHLMLCFPVHPTNVHPCDFSSVIEASFIPHNLWSFCVHPCATRRVVQTFPSALPLFSCFFPLFSFSLHSQVFSIAICLLSFPVVLPWAPTPLPPPPPHFCREFPCEKPCSQGLSAFESAEKLGLIARDTSDSKNKVIHLFSIINVIQQPLKLAQGMFGFYFVQWLVLLPR